MTTQDRRKGRPTRAVRGLLCALLAAFAAGCGPRDCLDARITAHDELGYVMWRGDAARDLTPRQLQALDRATQEIRFHLMATGTASGSAAVEAALLATIDQRTVRAVLQEGLGWELKRAEAERSTLEAGMRTNAQMRTRPGDDDSANYLADLRDRQNARLRAATDEVNRTRDDLAATGLVVPPVPRLAPDR